MSLGLKGGGNLTNAVGADAYNSLLRLGAHGGLLSQLELPAMLGLRGLGVQVEALYAMRGDNGIDYGFTIGQRVDYLNVPLLLKYHGRDGVFVEGGIQYGFQLRATPNVAPKPTVKPTPSVAPIPTVTPIVRENELLLEKRQTSFVAGFGFQDISGVSVGWRYVGGLSTVFQPSDNPIVGRRQLRNSSIEFYLNYCFSTGK